ncbi:MAG: mannose-6-phosphate isomerase, partial [Actinobacteria bacterium]|nr:mannose-6-phosphate isomerase [Actinomycetota bacterium]
MIFNDAVLDDAAALAAGDPENMLEAIATGGAQIRRSLLWVSEHAELFSTLTADGRPRALMVCGIGGSAVAGDIVHAATIAQSPIPVLSHRGYALPAWVGALDVVIAVSCSGETEETLTIFDEAVR